MSIIPSLTSRQLLALLLEHGFCVLRQKGSHVILEHCVTQRRTMIALHCVDLSRKMIATILKQAGIDPEEFFT